jgi:hypothetical protein
MVPPRTDAPARLRISAISGGVTVTAEARDDVVVDRGGAVRTAGEGAVEIRADRSSSVSVRCPTGADVIVGTRSGTVELVGSFGSVGVTSQSGSIRTGAAAEADLRTLSGTVQLEACEGRCRLSTKSGRIAVGETGDAEIATVSGSVGIDHATGSVQVRTVSGKVNIVTAGRGAVRVGTVSGSITIGLPAGVRPQVRFSGRGAVRSNFEPGADVLVDVANVSGTVRLVSA